LEPLLTGNRGWATRMSALEDLFNSSVLDVAVPDASLEYPDRGDAWLARLSSEEVNRKQAFFGKKNLVSHAALFRFSSLPDEQLQFFLVVRIEHPPSNGPVDIDHPPADLVALLSHFQVSLEATYISPTPVTHPEPVPSTRLSTPPRTTSFGPIRINDGTHSSAFPPATPNPTPSTADSDRRYIKSEGTLLLAKIWGQDVSEDSPEAFSLLWSQREQVWVALYRIGITVCKNNI